jgi:hypothetical protein
MLKKENGKVIITVGSATLPIVEKVFQQLKNEHGHPPADTIQAKIGPKQSFLAWYEPSGKSFPLLCIDSQSGKVLWTANAWASGGEILAFGSGPMVGSLHIKVLEQQVALFGWAAGSCYLEVLSRDTGTVSYRFSTDYWSVQP